MAFTGTPIPFVGQTADRDTGLPVPYAMVNIHLAVRGTTRVISAIADDAGEFSATFTPLPGEGGLYTIGAAHPGEATAPVQDSFTLLGMRAEPPEVALKVHETHTAVGQLTLYNLADVPLTGVTSTVIDAAANLEVEITLPGGGTLPGLAAWLVDYEITALDASITQSEFTIRVDSDQGAWVEVPVEESDHGMLERQSCKTFEKNVFNHTKSTTTTQSWPNKKASHTCILLLKLHVLAANFQNRSNLKAWISLKV